MGEGCKVTLSWKDIRGVRYQGVTPQNLSRISNWHTWTSVAQELNGVVIFLHKLLKKNLLIEPMMLSIIMYCIHNGFKKIGTFLAF